LARPHCRVALTDGASSQFRGEIRDLLRTRLALVAAIAFVPSLLFLVKNMFEWESLAQLGPLVLAQQVGVTMATGVLAGVLWTQPCMSLRTLRGLELALFGIFVAFFAWVQFLAIHQNRIFQVCDADLELPVVRLLFAGMSERWFILIVLYGVFIPSSGRRCALVVGAIALTPLVLTLVLAWIDGRLGPELLSGLGDMAVLLLTGVAIAVFGSHRIQMLQRQAFEAQQLGQYKLKRRLGAGGMGEVYLAEHTLLRRPCAVKLIRPDQAGDPTNLQRFEREVRAMATLTHWNTVEVFDYGHAQDGTFYYVMEYLPGQNLETLVAKHGPLPPARAVHFLRQVCRALREAHGLGILHRDIKPSNIIASERGGVFDVAKLLDFGLVQGGLGKDADRLTVKGTILGSPPYMSPEQAAGKDTVDARSDIYSLGGVAYFVLTGQAPFPRETAMLILLAHAHDPVVPPAQLRPEVPADVQEVVLRCLQKDPAQRFADVDSLEKALSLCRCAGEWTEECAAAWWRERSHEDGKASTSTDEMVPVPTRVLGG
jgi:serine/threonine-protein kinase